MKTVRNFSKAFPACVIASVCIIVVGLAGFFVRGINFGIDFVPGLIEEVKISSNPSIDDVRNCLDEQNVSVKELGIDGEKAFQIRAAINKGNEDAGDEIQKNVMDALKAKFGEGSIEVVKTDYVGPQFSSSLAGKSIILAIVTLFIIWLYATIRFHWDFALGSIIALIHDCLIMFAFISWSQVEFSTTTFAAVLTIFGYSINATVVILDRVRENIRLVDTKDFKDILNTSISSTLSRSVITTVTTLFASIALLVFTSGSIRDFAIVLTVGLISGCYSSMMISPAFISFARRNWEPGEFANHTRPHNA